MALTNDLAAAYSTTGIGWKGGPMQVYGRLAQVLVDDCPGGVGGRRVLDVGAGTGAFSRAARAAGAADVIALDMAGSMLAQIPGELRVGACVGDACRLPFAAGSFDVVGAAFSLNHLEDPAVALREACRVLVAGGAIVVSAYASDDDHPAKAAVESAAAAHGWHPPAWYDTLRRTTMPKLATEAAALEAADGAHLEGAVARRRQVTIPGMSPSDLVAWRLGLVQLAPWVRSLSAVERSAVTGDALQRLGHEPPTLTRSLITLVWSKRSS
jgi:SAM-dependent methyltransferase